MTRSRTFPPAAETTTPPRTSGPAAPRPSPPGPTSPASPWLHNHAYRRASLSRSRFPSICSCQVDGAARRAKVHESIVRRSLRIVGQRPADAIGLDGLHSRNSDGAFRKAANFKYVATVQSVTDETCHNRILLVDPTLIDPEM